MKKRTKIIILAVMIVLLGVTGYLNIALNNSVDETPTSTTTTSYFAAYRQDREAQRDQMLLYYQAIAESESSTPEAVTNANAAREALIAQMDTELIVEGLIKGLGYNDCVITMTSSNVKTKSTSLRTDLRLASNFLAAQGPMKTTLQSGSSFLIIRAVKTIGVNAIEM